MYNIPLLLPSLPSPPSHYHPLRLTGYSPFQGETHQETFLNVSTVDYDFDDEVFEVVSQDAKDFVEKLLIKQPRLVVAGAFSL